MSASIAMETLAIKLCGGCVDEISSRMKFADTQNRTATEIALALNLFIEIIFLWLVFLFRFFAFSRPSLVRNR